MRERADDVPVRKQEPAAAPGPKGGRPAEAAALQLQRTAGNRAVARTAAAAAPPATDGWDAEIAADVEWIVGKLSEQVLTQGEEYEILARLERYDDADFKRGIAGGGFQSALLDRMLLALKLRVFSRRTIGGAWHKQYSSAFDLLWHELENERQDRLKSLLARSKSFARDKAGESPENFWLTMGRQEAMGLLGIMKGLSAGAAGIVDAGAGGVTSAVNAIANPTGAPGGNVMADAIKPGEWVGKQYDALGNELFGRDWTEDKILFGRSAGQIGEFGGKVVWGLVMIGAGGQLKAGAGGMTGAGGAGAYVIPQGAAAAARAKLVLDALGLLGNVGAVTDAATALVKDIERLQKADKLGDALTDQQFGEHLIGLLAALYATAASAVGFRSPEAAKPGAQEAKWWAESVLPTLVEMAQIGPQFVRLADIYHSNMPDEQRAAAYGDAVEKILERIVNAAAGLAGAKDDRNNEKRTEAQGKMREGLAAIEAEKRAREQDKRYKAAEEKALPAAQARAKARTEEKPLQLDTRRRKFEPGVDEHQVAGLLPAWSAGEVGLGARWERGEGGVSKAVEYDIPRAHSNISHGGVDTREEAGGFHATTARETGDAEAQRPRDVRPTPLGSERSHGVPQAASASNIDPAIGFGDWSHQQIANDLMDLRNVWAARGLGAQGVNQRTLGGANGVEDRIARFSAAHPDKGLRCRIEPDFGSKTTVVGAGRPVPVPDVFDYKVFDTSRPGQRDLLIHVRVLNVPGTPPQIVKAPPGF